MSKASITQDLESLCSSTTSWELSPPKASLTPENCRCSEGFIQNRACGLPRTPIPRRSCIRPTSLLRRYLRSSDPQLHLGDFRGSDARRLGDPQAYVCRCV